MVDFPREVIGAVLKYWGASYNTGNIDSEVAGGRNAVKDELASFRKQAIPAASGTADDELGGRVRGPYPLLHQWLDFCLQTQRALPFEEEIVAGASPSALDNTPVRKPNFLSKNKPKLDTNLVSGVSPPDILPKCEFWSLYRMLHP